MLSVKHNKLMTSTIFIHTSVGKIAVHHRNKEALATPLFLLHGVYFDHRLWKRKSIN